MDTTNPIRVRRFEVQEDVGHIWPPPRPYLLNLLVPLRWCATLFTADFNGIVVANAWTRRGAVKKVRALWFEQARIATEDEQATILALFEPSGELLEGKS